MILLLPNKILNYLPCIGISSRNFLVDSVMMTLMDKLQKKNLLKLM